jgi:WD40 repeat protein
MGTVLNDIWIWEWHIPIETTNTTASSSRIDKQRLCGHQGVIHAIQFHHSNLLVSASDDQTVRLWQKRNDTNHWKLQWTGWGHTARIFDVAFCNHAKDVDPLFILSTGEDSLLRIWDCSTGALLQVWKGHSCQSVWCVDSIALAGDTTSAGGGSSSCWVVTGANNGTVALYDLARHTLTTQTSSKLQQQQSDDMEPPLIIPDDRHGPLKIHATETTTTSSTTTMKTKSKSKQKQKIRKQTLVGMQFREEPVTRSTIIRIPYILGTTDDRNKDD